MSFMRALVDGFRRAGRSWRLIVLLWLVNVAVALPFAVALAGTIDRHLDRSLVHENLLEGFDTGWYGELRAEGGDRVETFAPELIGAGAFFDNLERWWRGDLLSVPPVLVGAAIAYALVWAFLLGGVLERLRAPAGVATAERAGFFAACGRHFPRFARLAILAGVLYYLLYRLVRLGFGWLEEALRDVTSETTALLWTVAGAALTVLLLTLIRVVFDYAKIATVAEGRRSALGAAWVGARFVAARPFGALGLYWGVGLVAILLLALYAAAAPGPGQATWPGVVLAFLAGQLALAARLALRLGLLGAETVYYRGDGAGGDS